MPQAWDGRGRKATSKSLGVLKGHPSKGDASLCKEEKVVRVSHVSTQVRMRKFPKSQIELSMLYLGIVHDLFFPLVEIHIF